VKVSRSSAQEPDVVVADGDAEDVCGQESERCASVLLPLVARPIIRYCSSMAKNDPLVEIRKLSVAERIQLVEDIWDSIAAEPQALSLTVEQREELDRRLADQEANPGAGRPWDEVKARLLGSR
jgi:putative addiction module component (TIGR02574 family)